MMQLKPLKHLYSVYGVIPKDFVVDEGILDPDVKQERRTAYRRNIGIKVIAPGAIEAIEKVSRQFPGIQINGVSHSGAIHLE